MQSVAVGMRFPFLRLAPFEEAIAIHRAEVEAPGPAGLLGKSPAESLAIPDDASERLAAEGTIAAAHFALADLLFCAGAPIAQVATEQRAGLRAASQLLEGVSSVAEPLSGTAFLTRLEYVLLDALCTSFLVTDGDGFVDACDEWLAEHAQRTGAGALPPLDGEWQDAARAIRYHRAASPGELLELAYGGALDLYGLSYALAAPQSEAARETWRTLLWWWAETLYAGAMRSLAYGVDARSKWLHPRALVVLKTVSRLGLLDVKAATPGTMHPFAAYLDPALDTPFDPLPEGTSARDFLEAVVEHSCRAEGEGLQRAANFLVEVGWGVRDYGGHFDSAADDLLRILNAHWRTLPAALRTALLRATAKPSRMCLSRGRAPSAEWVRLVAQPS